MQGKLTERQVQNTNCPPSKTSIDLSDGKGLFLRVTAAGNRIWKCRYFKNGKATTITFGPYPAITLSDARRLRDEEQISQYRALAPQPPPPLPPPTVTPDPEIDNSITFQQLVDEYIMVLTGKKSQRHVQRALEFDAIPYFGDRYVKDITRRDCVLLLDKVKTRTPVGANRLYAYIKRAFRVGLERGLITSSPIEYLTKPDPDADVSDNSHKVLSLEQLQHFIRECKTSRFDDVLQMILWTGARPVDVLGMRWKQIEGDIWTLGAKEHKGSYRRTVVIKRPLIDIAITIINRHRGNHPDLVFPSPNGDVSPSSSLSHFLLRDRDRYGIAGFSPNNFRHTMSTRMREIGIRPDIVERIIGHNVDSGISGVYSSYAWVTEMRDALKQWHEWIIPVNNLYSEQRPYIHL